MPSRSAEAGTLRERQQGIEHQGDLEDDRYGDKAITHHADSAHDLTHAANSQ